MLKPPRLRAGDRVAVIAPASPFSRDEFDKGIAELQRLDVEPVFDESVFAQHRGYLAGDGYIRANAFLEAWRDPSIRALIAVRGGYGSVHLLPYLEQHDLRGSPKIFIGYSDLTTVLSYLTTGCEIVSFHGPMLDRRLGRGVDAYDPDTFMRALTSTEPLGELTAPALETFCKGEAAGPLMGGTLAQLVASLGTPFAFNPPKGYVLFLEDVAERPYRLDRMLTQLRLSGILAAASALVLGEFLDCDEPRGEPSGRAVLAELLEDFNGPVVYGFPSGHTTGPLVTLPFGVQARVIADGRPRVIIEEAGVE
ncbi:MAG TPA: LD-carboxypeptidase [Vicinamibacterales bacterium]|nr:LD-carboxypeptidase [Vicinamibacterales bacterium]